MIFMKQATGAEKYNLEFDWKYFKQYGVLSETGTQIHMLDYGNNMSILNWISDEEIEKIKEDRDPFDAPSISYYEPQPEKPGKLIWISGPPGAGKSTSGKLLGMVSHKISIITIFV